MQEAINTARQRRPLTLLGALIALVTVGAFLFVATRPAADGAPPVPGTAGKVGVVFAKQDIKGRATIVADMLDVRQMPVEDAPPGRFEKISDLIGNSKVEHFALIDIKAKQPVLVNALATSRNETGAVEPAYLAIPPGFVAMTIPTGEQQGVAGFIQAGDYIGIIAVVDGRQGTAAKTIFNNVHVIKVGTAEQSASGRPAQPKAGAASSLTVVMTECDAEYLNWFLVRASLRYTLEAYQDYGAGTANNPQKAEGCAIDKAAGVSNADVARRFGPAIIPTGAVGG